MMQYSFWNKKKKKKKENTNWKFTSAKSRVD